MSYKLDNNRISRNRLDLFTARRIKKNISLPLLKSNKNIIKKGIIILGGFSSIPIFIFLVLILQFSINKSSKSNLDKLVSEYDADKITIDKLNNESIVLKNTISKLVNSIVSIRSGSVILIEMSKIIPSSATLSKLDVNGNNLEIKGTVNQEYGLEIINLYLLKLRNSPFVKKESVRLIKAELSNEENLKGKNNDSGLSFLIICELKEKLEDVNTKYIKTFKSSGFVNRIKLLESRNLIK